MKEGRRFAVLLCAEDSDYVKKKYDGYFGVFVGMLGEESEIWDCYRVSAGDFPADADLDGYDGFVITGSCHDAHGSEEWIVRLLSLLKRLDSMRKNLLGICFGHQILCRALGGKTGRATNGWDIGVTTINFYPSKKLKDLEIPTTLKIIEIHRDEVWELPPQAEAVAWSDKTRIELFKYKEHIMGIQGHPEYSKDILTNIIDRLYERNLIQPSHVEAATASLQANELDQHDWKRLCQSFLKGHSIS